MTNKYVGVWKCNFIIPLNQEFLELAILVKIIELEKKNTFCCMEIHINIENNGSLKDVIPSLLLPKAIMILVTFSKYKANPSKESFFLIALTVQCTAVGKKSPILILQLIILEERYW